MSDEDREEALTLYEKMFDDTSDEQALIQSLLSPTRQAVIIARAYDANARKLQAYTNANRPQAAYEEPETTPEFVTAILKVYEEAVPLPAEPKAPVVAVEEEPPVPVVSPDQISLFPDDGQPDSEPAEEEPEEEEVPAGEETAEEKPADEVDVFLSELSIPDEALTDESGEVRAFTPEADEETPDNSGIVLPMPEAEEAPEAGEAEEETAVQREPRVFLLILFTLIAVPVALLGVALLLIPTLLSLLLSAGCIVGGCAGILAAFSGFPVFADILIVLGCAIIVLALGLLFLWLFIWFVSSGIAGWIRSITQLGRSWCYKEVAA